MFIWNIDPVMLRLGGIELRWYGLMFAFSFWIGQNIMNYIWRKENKSLATLDLATAHIALGTFLGARLGSVFFYNFEYYSQHPLEILLPVTFEPTFRFTGYQGLASHGASIGIITAIYIYINYAIILRFWPPKISIKRQQRSGQSYLWMADRLVITIALAGFFIRTGNLANSELYGKPTNSRYGVVFARDVIEQLKHSFPAIKDVQVTTSTLSATDANNYQPVTLTIALQHGSFEENTVRSFLEHHVKNTLLNAPAITSHIAEPKDQPLSYTLSKNKQGSYVAHINTLGIARHPAQFYESISFLIIFCLLMYYWHRKRSALRDGALAGMFLMATFSLRLFYESLKPGKVVFENEMMTLLMPQVLSVPLIIIGLVIFFYNTSRTKATR